VCSVAQACGQNVNFVYGLVDKLLDVQISAIRTKFVKYKHKYRNQDAVIHKLYTWSLAQTWSKFWGRRSRRVIDENFLPSPSKCEISGDGGTHCVGEFQYLKHGFHVDNI